MTFCDPRDYRPPGSSVHGILQARILEWVAMPSSRGSSQPRNQTGVSCNAGGFFTTWATMETQEYWNGLPCPPPGDLPNPGIKPGSPAMPVDSLQTELPGALNPVYPKWKLLSFWLVVAWALFPSSSFCPAPSEPGGAQWRGGRREPHTSTGTCRDPARGCISLWSSQQFLCQIRFKQSMIPKLWPVLCYFRTGGQPTNRWGEEQLQLAWCMSTDFSVLQRFSVAT